MKKRETKDKSPKINLDQLLIENMVSLQKIMSNLVIKLDNLAEQTSKLLGLFEISAKSFMQRQGKHITKEDKEFLDKLDRLLEQNKTIARGLTIVEEKIREKTIPPVQKQFEGRPRQLPRF